jgi:hypothetical protein
MNTLYCNLDTDGVEYPDDAAGNAALRAKLIMDQTDPNASHLMCSQDNGHPVWRTVYYDVSGGVMMTEPASRIDIARMLSSQAANVLHGARR